MNISYKQILWLRQMGDRTIFDVFVINKTMGVYMSSPHGLMFIPVPEDKRLVVETRNAGNQDRPMLVDYVVSKTY